MSQTIYRNAKGDWVASRAFRFPSGAQGYETVTLLRTTGNPFQDEARRAEAEAEAERLFGKDAR